MNASASAMVLFIFQFPAMNGVRLLTKGPPRRAGAYPRRAPTTHPAGREMVDLVGEAEVGERGGRVAAADHGGAGRGGDRLRHPPRARLERLELEGAHRA